MNLAARSFIEAIAERGREALGPPDVASRRTLPGYAAYETARPTRNRFRETAGAGAPPADAR